LKTGIDMPDRFVIVDSTGKERRIFNPGITTGLKTDVYSHYLVWDEVSADPRWPLRNYSEIRLLDLATGRLQHLTRRTRYFSPVFSPDGKTIAVVETDIQDQHFITLLSAESGQCIRRIPAPENREIAFPCWISVDQLAAVTISPAGKQIEQLNLADGLWSVLLPCSRFDISEPVPYRNFLLFRSAYSSIENIYAIDRSSRQLYQVTRSRFGAYNPAVSADSSELLFSNYTEQGFDLAGMLLDPSAWTKISFRQGPSGIWPGTEPADNTPDLTRGQNPASAYRITPYNKLTHLIHVHSWLPVYVPLGIMQSQVQNFPIDPGIMLFSQNLLSTFISTIGYHYTGGYQMLSPRFIWRGWYPVFELNGQIGGPEKQLPFPEGVTPGVKLSPYYEYTLTSYVPLVFNRGNYISYLQPQIEYEHNSTAYYAGGLTYTGLSYFHYRLYVSRVLRMSHRDLYPRLGAYLSATYTDAPGNHNQLGDLFSLQVGTYLPGIRLHDHLLFRAGWQKQFPGNFYLPINRINFPRGYVSGISSTFSSLSVDYAFPLAYPDLAMGPWIYLKRIRADLFHDWGYGRDILIAGDRPYTGNYRSAGIELLADFHFLRIIFPISAGTRVGYLFNQDRLFSELLLSIQITGL
jgi:hypothetical protein